MKQIDETGNRYGALTVLWRAISREADMGAARWMCRCDCGARVTRRGNSLRAGLHCSCGCKRRWGGVLRDKSDLFAGDRARA